MLLHRGGRWLLSVRSPAAAYAPGVLGLIGGHVEAVHAEPDVLEAAARREMLEETGLDLTGLHLDYLESEFFLTEGGEPQVTVTFIAPAPAGTRAQVVALAELSEVGWWSVAEAAADPRCPEWLPNLLERAGQAVS